MRVALSIVGVIAILIAIAVAVDSGTSDAPATCNIRRFAFLPDRCEGTCPAGTQGCGPVASQCYISIFGWCLATQANACACTWAPN